jgi:hypothetical protein
MNCAGSIALIGDESSSAGMPAMMGTAAHKVIETMISNNEHEAREYLGKVVLVKQAGDEPSELHDSADPYMLNTDGTTRAGWFAFPVNEDMVRSVQVTIDECDRIIADMFHPEIFAERFLDMSWLDPRCGGTADFTAVEPFGVAHLVDHKNGRVVVEVVDNDQLKNYAVGVAHEHPDCESVRVTISQPNAPHAEGAVRMVEFTRDELAIYEIEIKKAADATAMPNAPLRAGDWCEWCPAKTRCPAFEAMAMAEAAEDFGFSPAEGRMPETFDVLGELDVPTVNTERTDDLYRKRKLIPLLDQWSREVDSAILTHLMNGVPVGDLKLVRGKTNRKFIVDNVEVEQRVNKDVPGVALVDLWTEPKFKGPAQVEKLGADKDERKLMKAIVAELAAKPPGKLSVALANDPRPAVDPAEEAATEFAADPIEGED